MTQKPKLSTTPSRPAVNNISDHQLAIADLDYAGSGSLFQVLNVKCDQGRKRKMAKLKNDFFALKSITK